MATGDVGGPVTELIITCRAKVPMIKGDAVTLVDDYTVSKRLYSYPFGQCMSDSRGFLESVCIKVRGVAVFRMCENFYPNLHVPCLGSVHCVGDGTVQLKGVPILENKILKVDYIRREIHVLL